MFSDDPVVAGFPIAGVAAMGDALVSVGMDNGDPADGMNLSSAVVQSGRLKPL